MSSLKVQRRSSKAGDDRRWKILLYIHEFKQSRDYSPNNREIGAAVSLSSTSVTAYHLDRLKDDGLLDFVPTQARTVRLTIRGKELVNNVLKMRRTEDRTLSEWLKMLQPVSP